MASPGRPVKNILSKTRESMKDFKSYEFIRRLLERYDAEIIVTKKNSVEITRANGR